MRATTKQSGPPFRGFVAARWGSLVVLAVVTALDLWAIKTNSVNEFAGWGARGFQIIYGLPLIIIGHIIISQRPRHPIAWMILLVIPLSISGEACTEYYGFAHSLTAPHDLPLVSLAGWFAQWLWFPAVFAFLIYLPLTFPDGKLLTPRWRYLLWAAVIACSIALLWLAFYPDLVNIGLVSSNPFGLEFLRLETGDVRMLTLIPVAFAIPAFGSVILRYRRGDKELRQQMKWLIYIGSFAIFTPVIGNFEGLIFDIILFAVLLGFPVSLGISILRYRLWDIDILINKSLVFGALTVLLALVLAGSLYGLTGLIEDQTGRPLVALAISAVVFGLVFQPARYRLQRFVDRRFYNIQIDYQNAPRIIHELQESISSPASLEGYGGLQLIGEGGMAKVYKAEQGNGGAPVAIKVLPERLISDADFSTRFRREAETIAKLQHPNIVDVYTYGEEGSLHFMVMEYLNGPDIGEHLAQTGKLTLSESLPIINNIAAALDYAHGQGLVHRDIKPSNIMLHYNDGDRSQPPRAVLMDFGIAKLLDKTAITKTGGLLGTFDYIAPEQIQEAGNLDHRADIYSFGVLVFQMLTGRLPFEHSTPAAALIAHISQPPPHPREIDPDIPLPAAEAILKALAKAPEDRFASAGDFAAALAIS